MKCLMILQKLNDHSVVIWKLLFLFLGSFFCLFLVSLSFELIDGDEVVFVNPGGAGRAFALFSWLQGEAISATVANSVSTIFKCFAILLWILKLIW